MDRYMLDRAAKAAVDLCEANLYREAAHLAVVAMRPPYSAVLAVVAYRKMADFPAQQHCFYEAVLEALEAITP